MIKGRVIDAENGHPIEYAAVFIYWGKRGPGPPGLAADTVPVEVAEVLTDAAGVFELPKYSWMILCECKGIGEREVSRKYIHGRIGDIKQLRHFEL